MANYGKHLIPEAFADLKQLDMPRIIQSMALFWGLREGPGLRDEKVILDMARKVGEEFDLKLGYSADSIPWCGLFTAYIVMSAGRDIVKTPLWAQSWAEWGEAVTKVGEASLGDILVYQRKNSEGKIIGGHVGPYIGTIKNAKGAITHLVCGGGNQGDTVQPAALTAEITWKPGARTRLMAIRRPKYNNKPLTAVPVMRDMKDVISGAALV